jgi:uncharacterized protein YabN with tetrapyrrole methylase and pyrophosphatase domain
MEPRSELELRSLVELVAHLRSERGCPWDRAQTHESLKSLLIEEAYETVAAIESGESQALQDELGDLLLHVAFHVQIAQEQKEFTLHDVLLGIYEKVVRRHPHVFGTESPTGRRADQRALGGDQASGRETLVGHHCSSGPDRSPKITRARGTI